MTDFKFSQIRTVVACHSLEDFPVHLQGTAANELLTCWCGPWHPQLVAASRQVPAWCSTLDLPDISESTLYVVPSSIDEHDVLRLSQHIESAPIDAKSQQVRGDTDLSTLHKRLLGSTVAIDVDAEIVRDFYALGYWYLQIQLLTRRMHYSTQLDEDQFCEHLVAGTDAALAKDVVKTHDELSKCFGVLAEERDHYYPVDAYLLDLTLVADSTCGTELIQELQGDTPVNLAVTGKTVHHMASRQPETLAALKAAISDDRASILGGEWEERELPLLPAETILEEFQRGRAELKRLTGSSPTQYVRRRFGLGPIVPLLLERFGYSGALHATLDDGQFPVSYQSRIRWEGWGGTAIDSLNSIPLDAARDETFLGLGERMGESMESDYVATVCLAHWPGRTSQWYDMLRRGTQYGLALGRFTLFDQYFQDSAYAGQLESYDVDQYQSPFLLQAVQNQEPTPISRWVHCWQHRCLQTATTTLRAWTEILAGERQIWCELPAEALEPGAVESVTSQLRAAYVEAAKGLAKRTASAGETTAYHVFNPWNSAERTSFNWSNNSLSGKSLPTIGKPVYAVDADRHSLTVDVPACGFTAVVPNQNSSEAQTTKPSAASIVDTKEDRIVLRNEFLEAGIDSETGGMRFLYGFATRGNRLSQRLTLCDPSCGPIRMQAAAVDVTSDTPLNGEITSRGELIADDDRSVAKFTQRFQVNRGSRIVQLQMDLEPFIELGGNPWKSYFGCRFAWADESSEIVRDVQHTQHSTKQNRFTAPMCIDLVDGNKTTSILTRGLPFHRKVASRQLDTLLMVRGEQARTFSLGMGVDLRHPIANSMSQLAQPISVESPIQAGANQSGWLFHIDARHILATGWEALWGETDSAEPSGKPRCVGVRVRLQETAGHGGVFSLRTFREVASATKMSFDGRELADYEVCDGVVRVELVGYEWTAVDLRW